MNFLHTMNNEDIVEGDDNIDTDDENLDPSKMDDEDESDGGMIWEEEN